MINSILSRAVIGQPEPQVGMGCTFLSYSDRSAATITEIINVGKTVIISATEDDSRVVSGSGHDGSAVYEHTPDPRGRRRHFRRLPDGVWQAVRLNAETGRWNKTGSLGLSIGHRDTYHDPSF
jgi:hypothetical protein